jgi:hypothetical protein
MSVASSSCPPTPPTPSAPAVTEVSLLKQAGLDAPLQQLAREPVANDSEVKKTVKGSRELLARALELSRAGAKAELDEAMRGLVGEALRLQRGSHRNRTLFLAAVLSGDPNCADALGRAPGAAKSLCDAVCDARRLSVVERQWAAIVLAQLAARPANVSHLVHAGLPRRLATLLRGEARAPPPPQHATDADADADADADTEAIGTATSAAQPARKSSAATPGAAPTATPAAAPAAAPTAAPAGAPAAPSPSTDAALVGLCFVAAAAAANLSLTTEGACASLRAGVLLPLLSLLTTRRGSVSLPSARWLLSSHRTVMPSVHVGGGAARALLNTALSSTEALAAIRAADAAAPLHALAQLPASPAAVRNIAAACLRVVLAAPLPAALPLPPPALPPAPPPARAPAPSPVYPFAPPPVPPLAQPPAPTVMRSGPVACSDACGEGSEQSTPRAVDGGDAASDGDGDGGGDGGGDSNGVGDGDGGGEVHGWGERALSESDAVLPAHATCAVVRAAPAATAGTKRPRPASGEANGRATPAADDAQSTAMDAQSPAMDAQGMVAGREHQRIEDRTSDTAGGHAGGHAAASSSSATASSNADSSGAASSSTASSSTVSSHAHNSSSTAGGNADSSNATSNDADSSDAAASESACGGVSNDSRPNANSDGNSNSAAGVAACEATSQTAAVLEALAAAKRTVRCTTPRPVAGGARPAIELDS